AGELVCAGGILPDTSLSLASTYAYHPASNTWTRGADMPYDNWGMAASGAGGRLQVVGGVTANNSALTNQAAQYAPFAASCAALPNANSALYRGGGACGMYQIGGHDSVTTAVGSSELLPGYDQCGDVPWLSADTSTVNLAPGQSATVTVRLDAAT